MGKYRAVSAAEKYAEVGEERPRCECCSQHMVWHKSPSCPDGGFWGHSRSGVPGRHKAVSAAEIYSATSEKKKCPCHGEDMWWSSDPNCVVGGYWRCPVQRREVKRKHYRNNIAKYKERQSDPKQREKVNARNRKRWISDPVFRDSQNQGRQRRQRMKDNSRDREKINSLMALLPKDLQTQLREVMQSD